MGRALPGNPLGFPRAVGRRRLRPGRNGCRPPNPGADMPTVRPVIRIRHQTIDQATRGEHAMRDFKLLIDGRLVEGAGTLDVINPATRRLLATAPRADRAQLDEAVAAAKAAFPGWSATPLRERGVLLVKLAEALEAGQAGFARLLPEEKGKPSPEALFEIGYSIPAIRYFATLDLPTEVLKDDPARKGVRRGQPLGVVGGST